MCDKGALPFSITCTTTNICVIKVMSSPSRIVVGPWPLYWCLFTNFKTVSFWLHNRCGRWKDLVFKPYINHIVGMIIGAPTTHPTTVCYRCAIERFVVFLWLCIVCRVGLFVIRLRQISFLFLDTSTKHISHKHFIQTFLAIENKKVWHI